MEITRGMTGPRVAAINEEYYRRFQATLEEGVRTYPDVRETLAALAGRRIGTMTTRRRKVADRMLRLAGIREYFTGVVGGDEVARPKPEPDLAVFAAKSLGVHLSDCVVVGDAPVDILAGRAAGAWTVAALYGYGDRDELLAAGPHATIDRFASLLPALAIVESQLGP
jgi:HAD superfamily hydrolase (TIGR01509 family)